MGCCCCCVSGRKPRSTTARTAHDLESQNPPTDPPPPYDFKPHTTADSIIPEKQAALPHTITTKQGVRSTDQRLYQAAAGGHLEDVKRLLELGFNPSDRTVCDWCPLHWAAHNDIEHGHEIVKLLVQYGADINQVSDTGFTPLDMAKQAKKSEIVRFLEEMGGKSGLEVRGVGESSGLGYCRY